LESVTGQVLHQVSEHLERQQQDAVTQFRQKIQTDQAERDVKVEAMSHQLSTMTALVAELTKELQSLRQAVVVLASSATSASTPEIERRGGGPAPPPVRPPPDPVQTLRQTIGHLLQEKRYEEAFTKAVSTGTVEMTVFCCQNANLQEVLGGSQPCLSQPILLCLMQQLGSVLSVPPNANLPAAATDSMTDATLELLDWLQEIALSINPSDPSIQRHVPAVLQQVAHNIQQRIEAPDLAPQLRRPLQRMLQVVRGVQMG
jgi:enhancer of mRNA-decapping protein 4